MTGQKQRIIRRFEREAKKRATPLFRLDEIIEIINYQGYDCGHNGKPIILDDNELSITAFYEWCESVGWKGNKTQCWECFCEESNFKDLGKKAKATIEHMKQPHFINKNKDLNLHKKDLREKMKW